MGTGGLCGCLGEWKACCSQQVLSTLKRSLGQVAVEEAMID